MLACVGAASFAMALPLRRMQMDLVSDYSSVFGRWELWKILLNKVAFTDPKDMVCGLLLLYYFRIFERRYGTRKFVSYLLATGLMSLSLELGLLFASAKLGIPHIAPFPAGPYGIVFSLFVAYTMDIPRATFTHILGMPVTGKTFTYLLGLQMACGSTQAICAAACGLLSGTLYRLNFAHIQTWLRVPMAVARACHVVLGQWLDPPSAAPALPLNMGATLELQQQQLREQLEEQVAAAAMAGGGPAGFGRGGGHNRFFGGGGPFGAPADADQFGRLRRRHPPTPPPIVPPSEDQIAKLVEMGFPREQAVSALQRTSNDLQSATVLLLQDS